MSDELESREMARAIYGAVTERQAKKLDKLRGEIADYISGALIHGTESWIDGEDRADAFAAELSTEIIGIVRDDFSLHPKRSKLRHGTQSMYSGRNKCRCDACRAANTQYSRDHRKKLRQEAGKESVSTVVAFIEKWRGKAPNHEGSCHCIVDDYYDDDDSIAFVLKWAIEEGDAECANFSRDLSSLPEGDRLDAIFGVVGRPTRS